MIVLGIDPGTIITGFGVVHNEGDDTILLKYGCIKTKERSPIGERLAVIYSGLLRVIEQYKPDEIAVEQQYVAKNARSALQLGRAQAVAILAGANRGIPVYEYTPSQVKQRITNFGGSSKEQIQNMIMMQLKLNAVPEPTDAADALAIALCHLQETYLQRLLANNL